MGGAERMEMMFSLGWDIFPVKFKQCSSLASFWVGPFVLEFSLLWALSSQATPVPRLPSAPHFAESPNTLRKEQPRRGRAETMGHRVTSAATVFVLYRETRLSREAENREKETDTERKEERWRERESDQTPSVLHLTMLWHSAWPRYSLGGSRNDPHPPTPSLPGTSVEFVLLSQDFRFWWIGGPRSQDQDTVAVSLEAICSF